VIDLDSASLRHLIEERLRETRPRLEPEALRLPGLPGDLPASLRPRLRAQKLIPAAVLVPLVERPDGLYVLLTQRTAHLRDHAGQVSFPGGRIEPEDASPAAAALRETFEEIGVGAEYIQVVGYLDTYLTVTGYSVVPVVGFVRPGFTLAVDEFEVASVFEVPLDLILDPANHVVRRKEFHGVEVGYYEIPFAERHIWGATAGMLVGLYQALLGTPQDILTIKHL
jgi:8-oxo-dGTP pyrophosphatase MutT (NUDIX family)